jgi:hypothetical protein
MQSVVPARWRYEGFDHQLRAGRNGGDQALGYTFDASWKPRLAFQYDLSSGDTDSTDGHHNRYDTLFGALRFGHGPTGIFGAFARGNIHSSGVRLFLKPSKATKLMFAHRLCWLASKTDAWTTSGLRDVTGTSGRFIGNQIEGRLRWEPYPSNLRIETGAAHLFAGEFIRNAPNNTGQGSSSYGYKQATFTF